jgi:hypothetical protein
MNLSTQQKYNVKSNADDIELSVSGTGMKQLQQAKFPLEADGVTKFNNFLDKSEQVTVTAQLPGIIKFNKKLENLYFCLHYYLVTATKLLSNVEFTQFNDSILQKYELEILEEIIHLNNPDGFIESRYREEKIQTIDVNSNKFNFDNLTNYIQEFIQCFENQKIPVDTDNTIVVLGLRVLLGYVVASAAIACKLVAYTKRTIVLMSKDIINNEASAIIASINQIMEKIAIYTQQFHIALNSLVKIDSQLLKTIVNEINNYSNCLHLTNTQEYLKNLSDLITQSQRGLATQEDKISYAITEIEWTFLIDDLYKMLQCMQLSTERMNKF